MNRTVHTRFASFAQAHSLRTLILLATLLLGSVAVMAQTTSFTYQGRLTDGGNPANGSYDIQVKLFDALTGGTQIGATNSLNGVAVSGGVFTVTLDFGAAAFPGANRWAEISAKTAGSASFTTLTPRQPVTSTPYAIKSLNAGTADGLSASCTGCVTGAQIGSLPATSGNYIQNATALQANSNFNITGNGFLGGKLGIGTTTSTFQLGFADTLGDKISLYGQSGNHYGFGIQGSLFQIHTIGASDDIAFGYGSSAALTETMRIKGNGNVGIGTTSPIAKLDISGSNSLFNGVAIRLFNANADNTNQWVLGTGGGAVAKDAFSIGDNSAYRMTILSNGNIGIGTTSPGSLLTLKSGSATATALEVNQGAIKVAGAGIGTATPVFIHKASAQTINTNVCQGGNCTVIDHPLTNGDANAILIITPNWNAGLAPGVYNNHPIGVFFTGVNWVIFNQDIAAMPVGAAFNVLVVKP